MQAVDIGPVTELRVQDPLKQEEERAKTAYGQHRDVASQEYGSRSEKRKRAKIVEEVTNRLYKGTTSSGL